MTGTLIQWQCTLTLSRPTGYVFSVVAVKRKERGVHAASAWPNPATIRDCLSPGKVRTVKRPQGRAPTAILALAVNTYPVGRERVRVGSG